MSCLCFLGQSNCDRCRELCDRPCMQHGRCRASSETDETMPSGCLVTHIPHRRAHVENARRIHDQPVQQVVGSVQTTHTAYSQVCFSIGAFLDCCLRGLRFMVPYAVSVGPCVFICAQLNPVASSSCCAGLSRRVLSLWWLVRIVWLQRSRNQLAPAA